MISKKYIMNGSRSAGWIRPSVISDQTRQFNNLVSWCQQCLGCKGKLWTVVEDTVPLFDDDTKYSGVARYVRKNIRYIEFKTEDAYALYKMYES